MTTKQIDMKRDFTRYPAGRYKTDGPYTGEHFRTDVLLPALSKFDRVEILMDSALGYGPSFLDEAFAGLVRRCGFSAQDVLDRITFTTSDPVVREMVISAIQEAAQSTPTVH